MKKFIAILIATVMLVSGMLTAYAQYNISINGEIVPIPENLGEVKAHNDRTFVPVRFILENFGYKVEYIQEEKLVMGTDGKGSLFIMQIGSKTLFFKPADTSETTEVIMDVEPFVDYEEGRIYVPARFLVEEIGYNVDYDAPTKTVLITSK